MRGGMIMIYKSLSPESLTSLFNVATKKEKSFRTSLLVPYDILFSNEYLRDLGRIWELREIVPDPNNMPWIEKIDK